MMRILGIALAVALAAAIVPQGAPPAEAAKKAKKVEKGNTAKIGSSDLADWQANYGSGSVFNKRPKRVKRFKRQ